MSKLFGKLGRLLTSARAKPVGKDLEGNRYFEIPSPNGGRTKRTVDYAIKRDIADYTDGQRLPVQWLSWLSHTRSTPPSLEELQKDMERQVRLRQNVLEIEARDAEETNRRLLAQPEHAAREEAEPEPASQGSASSSASSPHAQHPEPQPTNLGTDPTATSRLSHLSPRSPPSPQKGDRDPSGPSSPLRATAQPAAHDPNVASSPTLRELSQLRMERERAELERQGVSLAEAAGHEADAPGAAMGVHGRSGEAKAGVQAAIPAARRRGAGAASPSTAAQAQQPPRLEPVSSQDPSRGTLDEARLGPQSRLLPRDGTAPHSSTGAIAPEPAGATSTSPSEFARAHAEMRKSPLEGYAPVPTDAKHAAQAGRPAADIVKDSTRETGTKKPAGMGKGVVSGGEGEGLDEPVHRPGQGPLYGERRKAGQGPLYGDKPGVWDAARASRARGE